MSAAGTQSQGFVLESPLQLRSHDFVVGEIGLGGHLRLDVVHGLVELIGGDWGHIYGRCSDGYLRSSG